LCTRESRDPLIVVGNALRAMAALAPR
jgi:hypothetical protein